MPTEAAPDALDSQLLERWEATLPHQRELGEALLRRYHEPQRRYHTHLHLQQVLERIDELADDHDVFLVKLAAWFHDAVYAIPVGQLPNEEASARLSVRELSRAGLEQEDMTQVSRLVRMTETHIPGARDPEGELLCDADLAILAADPDDYARYVDQVREEYRHVPDEAFWSARLAVLTELVQRPLFRTGKGQRFVPAARANVDGEIATLSDRLGIAVEGSRS